MRFTLVHSITLHAALFSLLPGLVVSAAPALSVAVSGPTTITDVENLRLNVTFTNTGQETLKLINEPGRALTTSATHSFLIDGPNKVNPSFVGILTKYAGRNFIATNGTSGAFTVLGVGKSVVVTHDLSRGYNFEASGSGKYTVRTHDVFHYVDSDKRAVPIQATIQPHQFTLQGKLTPTKSEADPHELATFTGCTVTQQTQINAAAAAAKKYVAESHSYVGSHSAATPRFTTWFGAFQSGRRNVVLSNFNSLMTHGDEFTGWKYDCTDDPADCEDGDFAFVQPAIYGVVHLCAGFWPAPVTGINSKAGTLVHEGSHFVATAGTTDFAYGRDDCKKLAIDNPNQAIRNADSYEYFAENIPPLQ